MVFLARGNSNGRDQGPYLPNSAKFKEHFKRDFKQLPTKLQPIAKTIYGSAALWNVLTPKGRLEHMLWYDIERDPETDPDELAAFKTLSEEVDYRRSALRDPAIKRWKLIPPRAPLERKRLKGEDKLMIARKFNEWCNHWRRDNGGIAPSREQAYREFGLPEGIGRRQTHTLLMSVRKDVRRKRGRQPNRKVVGIK